MAFALTFPESGNLYRPLFDTAMIVWLPLVAMAATALVLVRPALLGPVILFDLWVLGYHHVVATYTRTAMDSESFRRYWALTLMLPVLIFFVLLGWLASSTSAALWITTLYLHWQLFHYIRQSEGISKAYAGRGGRHPEIVNDPLCRAAFYAAPVTAFLTMAAQGQANFLGFPVWMPQLQLGALAACWIATALLCLIAAKRTIRAARKNQLTPQHMSFLLSHYVIFVVAYAGVRDIVVSWLMANIWHNGQYLAFVWAQNRQRFNDKVEERHRLLSTLCQHKNAVLYVAFCMSVTFAIYKGASFLHTPLRELTGLGGLAIAVVISQTINFHHYVVDAIIWRRPKPKLVAIAPPASS